MDVDYARLANAVPLPEGIKNIPKAAKPTVVSNAQQAYTSPPPEEVHFQIYNFQNISLFAHTQSTLWIKLIILVIYF